MVKLKIFLNSGKKITAFGQVMQNPKDLKKFWLICYTPQVNFDCNIPNSRNLELIDVKKKYLIEAKLYKLN